METPNSDLEMVIENWQNGNRKDAIRLAQALSKSRFGFLIIYWHQIYTPKNVEPVIQFLLNYTESSQE